jgi:hypothetical protein
MVETKKGLRGGPYALVETKGGHPMVETKNYVTLSKLLESICEFIIVLLLYLLYANEQTICE